MSLTFISTEEQFDPEAPKVSYPPLGEYSLCLMGAKALNKDAASGRYVAINGTPAGRFDATELTFEIASGDKRGMRFTMMYNTGHSNILASKIAREAIQTVYWAATGIKVEPRTAFDITKAYGKPFLATLAHTVKNGDVQKDKNGYPYHSLIQFKLNPNGVSNATLTDEDVNGDIPWDK